MSDRKLVVLGVPWDVDTEGLREYMSKFGDLEDCIVMKERSTGRSRGFGYVTFAAIEDAKAALTSEHFLGNRVLEVKIATPKEEMRAPSKKVTRIFVARILQSVTEAAFRSHFEKYGDITDLYMPKDPNTKGHRGIGFITFSIADAVDDLMADTHELGGSTVVVDRATPKDPKRTGHRGFGFVTFADDGVADRVARRSHEICGHQVAIDSATPIDDPSPNSNFMVSNPPEPYGYGGPGYGGHMRSSYGRMYGSLDFDDWGYGAGGSMGGGRPSRPDYRYRPY